MQVINVSFSFVVHLLFCAFFPLVKRSNCIYIYFYIFLAKKCALDVILFQFSKRIQLIISIYKYNTLNNDKMIVYKIWTFLGFCIFANKSLNFLMHFTNTADIFLISIFIHGFFLRFGFFFLKINSINDFRLTHLLLYYIYKRSN